MKKQIRSKFHTLFIIICFALLSCSSSAPEKLEMDEIKTVETSLINPVYIEGDSTWTIEERMAHYGVPGVSIAVIKDFKIEWVKSYGVADIQTQELVTDQTLFQAGSISKPVAATGALKLAEQKKIDLNGNVNNYLKSWKLPDNSFTIEKQVTLKHLLNHSAGVTVHGFLGYSPDLLVPTLVQVLDGSPPANSSAIFVDKAPEVSFRYSGGGYCIMQQMMIDVAGKSFPMIMKELVLDPLAMNSSTYDQPLKGAQSKMAATGLFARRNYDQGQKAHLPRNGGSRAVDHIRRSGQICPQHTADLER